MMSDPITRAAIREAFLSTPNHGLKAAPAKAR